MNEEQFIQGVHNILSMDYKDLSLCYTTAAREQDIELCKDICYGLTEIAKMSGKDDLLLIVYDMEEVLNERAVK